MPLGALMLLLAVLAWRRRDRPVVVAVAVAGVALVVAVLTVMAIVWAGARVFRVGVLMQGKTPTPRELLRWIRTR